MRAFASAFFFSRKAMSSCEVEREIGAVDSNIQHIRQQWAQMRATGLHYAFIIGAIKVESLIKNIHTSSYSLGPFLGAFSGLALPPSLPTIFAGASAHCRCTPFTHPLSRQADKGGQGGGQKSSSRAFSCAWQRAPDLNTC